MGSVLFRNRYWFYKSLYDDYIGREMRLAFGLSMVLWMPHYWYAFAMIIQVRYLPQQNYGRRKRQEKLPRGIRTQEKQTHPRSHLRRVRNGPRGLGQTPAIVQRKRRQAPVMSPLFTVISININSHLSYFSQLVLFITHALLKPYHVNIFELHLLSLKAPEHVVGLNKKLKDYPIPHL